MAAVQAFLTQAPLLRTPHPLAVSPTVPSKHRRTRRVGLLATQPDDGMEIGEPTLEESLDAIDDVVMNRPPGEGELSCRSRVRFVTCFAQCSTEYHVTQIRGWSDHVTTTVDVSCHGACPSPPTAPTLHRDLLLLLSIVPSQYAYLHSGHGVLLARLLDILRVCRKRFC